MYTYDNRRGQSPTREHRLREHVNPSPKDNGTRDMLKRMLSLGKAQPGLSVRLPRIDAASPNLLKGQYL